MIELYHSPMKVLWTFPQKRGKIHKNDTFMENWHCPYDKSRLMGMRLLETIQCY